MTTLTITRPEETEYLPYYGKYVALVHGDDILAVLSDQLSATLALLRGIPESQAGFRYADGKWSINELVGHLIDSERIFAYRALRFGRNDKTPVPGFEQDDYIRNASFDACSFGDLAAEFESVRRATLFLFKHLDAGAWLRRGIANESEVSVRAIAYIIAGHELHHVGILRERYLSSTQSN
ncbi:MAG TPA: DinB family protein [Pyrinomonadaceae bacterium]|nr:DinB family protein [Pyrinomonadaceae bacterium]